MLARGHLPPERKQRLHDPLGHPVVRHGQRGCDPEPLLPAPADDPKHHLRQLREPDRGLRQLHPRPLQRLVQLERGERGLPEQDELQPQREQHQLRRSLQRNDQET